MEIDPKYPQSIGISNILSRTAILGNFQWDVMTNPFEDSAFFTSDFPAAIEKSDIPGVINVITPLTPNLAVRIRQNPQMFDDSSFSRFRSVHKKLSRKEVRQINRLIVRCAESTVFYRDEYEWVSKFVARNCAFRIELRALKVPQGKGALLAYIKEIRETV